MVEDVGLCLDKSPRRGRRHGAVLAVLVIWVLLAWACSFCENLTTWVGSLSIYSQ